eukprot:g2057.t1
MDDEFAAFLEEVDTLPDPPKGDNETKKTEASSKGENKRKRDEKQPEPEVKKKKKTSVIIAKPSRPEPKPLVKPITTISSQQKPIESTSKFSFVTQRTVRRSLKKNVSKTKDKVVLKNKEIIMRSAGGQVWKDESLLEWDPNDFRLWVGNLGNEVTEAMLDQAFKSFGSVQKVKIIRKKFSSKCKGYGFVSFKDGMDCLRAMKDMQGKYLGSKPIKIKKANWSDRMKTNVDYENKRRAKIYNKFR